MEILVYGAGNIGSLYAALLHEAGQDVSILARGSRLADIRAKGVRLEEFHSGRRTTTRVKTAERFEPDDFFDLVLVALPKNHIAEVLPILAETRHAANVMFFGNNAAGFDELTQTIGRSRVLFGFPGAAAVRGEDRLRYLILSRHEQPTTIGEIDGTVSARLRVIGECLRSAGFPVTCCANMDAWLKTHAMEIVPTACALYMAEGDSQRLAQSPDVLRLLIRAIREGYRVLHERGVPVTPATHRIVEWLPEPLLLALAKRRIGSEATSIKVGHAQAAREEMKSIAEEIRTLTGSASTSTPAMDRLNKFL